MIAAAWAPDAVLDLSGVSAWPGVALHAGRPAIEAFLAEWRAAWSRDEERAETVAEADRRVLRATRIRAAGRDSGAGVEGVVWLVEERRDGATVAARVFDAEAPARAHFGA